MPHGSPVQQLTEMPWSKARTRAHAAPAALSPNIVSLADAAGHTLAEDLLTRTPLPAFDTAAMDGYAIAGSAPYVILGEVRPGAPWNRPLGNGTSVAISTGAQVPVGTDAIIPIETAEILGSTLVSSAQQARTHIRRAGEDASIGALMSPAGVVIGPALLGLAASCGYDVLSVRPRPTVHILITGDELRCNGVSGDGLVRDALCPMLPSLVSQLGGTVTGVEHVPDHPSDKLGDAISAADALNQGAVIVVTGSTSVGPTDRLRPFLRGQDARWVVKSVACQPGHPQLLAQLGTGAWVVGLPGNPFAALVAAHTLLGPLLAGLCAQPATGLPTAFLRGDVACARNATRLVPVAWDGPNVRALAGHGSAFLRGAAVSDALAALPPRWDRNQPVPLVLMR